MLSSVKCLADTIRKARLLFALSDVILIVLAFEAAYETRLLIPNARLFYFTVPVKALLLGAAIVDWLLLGHWLEICYRLDSAHSSIVLRDTFRQCILGGIILILQQFPAPP